MTGIILYSLTKISFSSFFRSNKNNLMFILFYLLLFHLILILLVYLKQTFKIRYEYLYTLKGRKIKFFIKLFLVNEHKSIVGIFFICAVSKITLYYFFSKHFYRYQPSSWMLSVRSWRYNREEHTSLFLFWDFRLFELIFLFNICII